MSIYSHSFRDWSDYLRAVDEEHVSRAFTAYAWEAGKIGGVTSIEQCRELAANGWADGMAHVRSLAMPIVESVVTRRTVGSAWAWDVTGAAYDVGEYLSGAPECWLVPAVGESKPVVSIQVDLGLRAIIPGNIVTMRGAGVVALTLALQAAGYFVDVSAVCGSGCGNDHFWLRVPLVDGNGGPIDVDRLLFALAHPANVRVFMFALGANLTGHPAGYATREGGSNPWTADLVLRRIQESETDWCSYTAVSKWVARTFEQLTQTKGDN